MVDKKSEDRVELDSCSEAEDGQRDRGWKEEAKRPARVAWWKAAKPSLVQPACGAAVAEVRRGGVGKNRLVSKTPMAIRTKEGWGTDGRVTQIVTLVCALTLSLLVLLLYLLLLLLLLMPEERDTRTSSDRTIVWLPLVLDLILLLLTQAHARLT
jgi:hypothetical protein